MKTIYMKGKRLGVAMMAVGAVLPVCAQLNKEITIERDIVPEIRGAQRQSVYPRALAHESRQVRLEAHDLTGTTAIPAMTATLEAARTRAASPLTPYRGYLSAGYFPAEYAGVSAGYGIISNSSTSLNVWGQFNLSGYKRNVTGYSAAPAEAESGLPVATDLGKGKSGMSGGRLGVDFSKIFGDKGVLSIGTSGGFYSFLKGESAYCDATGEIWPSEIEKKRQGVFLWDITADWKGRTTGGLRYHIGAEGSLFNFNGDYNTLAEVRYNSFPDPGLVAISTIKNMHETGWGFGAGISQNIKENSLAGVELDVDMNGFNHWNPAGEEFTGGYPDWLQRYAGSKTVGAIGLTPYYRLSGEVFSMKLGVKAEAAVGGGKTLHVAPDVLLSVTPASGFGAWLSATGGEHVNTLREMWLDNRYVSPRQSYRNSSVPVKADLGLRFGPVKGVSLTVKASYAMANDWLLPVCDLESPYSAEMFTADLRSWKAGAELNWHYGTIAEVSAGFEMALGSGLKETWLEWRDRSRSRVNVAASVRPLERLTIDLGYELRLKRKMEIFADEMWAQADTDLGNYSNLSLGATYRVTDAFSVFARGENLTGEKNRPLPGLCGEGVHGLAGISFKF